MISRRSKRADPAATTQCRHFALILCATGDVERAPGLDGVRFLARSLISSSGADAGIAGRTGALITRSGSDRPTRALQKWR